MQFVVIARDESSPEAPARRAAARADHLEAIRPFVEAGQILVGGAVLDADDVMVGSVLITEFGSRDELDAWLSRDPYVTAGVWESIEVWPYRAAVGAWMPE